jgi:allantoinase
MVSEGAGAVSCPAAAAPDPRSHSTWLASRPRRFEKHAVRALVSALRSEHEFGAPAAHGFRLHVVHLADADLIPEVEDAKREGLPLSAETCTHYLTFADEDIPKGDTRYKCAPPIREAENRARLWDRGVLGGVLDLLSSDHSPAPPELKHFEDGDFMAAWGGISGLQYSLPATWDGLTTRGRPPADLHRLWSTGPAELAGLHRKGSLTRGKDADIVVWDAEAEADTSRAALQHKHKATPYEGLRLKGRVVATFVRGSMVFGNGDVAEEACGRPVLRK